MRLPDLRIGPRVALAFGAVVATIVLLVALTQAGLSRSAANSADMGAGVKRQAQASEIHLLAKDNAIAGMVVLVSSSGEQQKRLQQEIQARDARIVEGLATLEKALAGSPEDAALIADIVKRHATYRAGVAHILSLVGQGKQAEAAFAADEEMIPMLAPFLDGLAKLDARQVAKVGETEQANARLIALTQGQSLVAGLVAVLIASAAGAWIVLSLTRPLARAVAFASRVASGDLTGRIEATGRDEVAQLLRELGRMSESLARVVTEVREASDTIVTGSTQIAAGNQDLSARTEEQASNLQETAASMEELTATVKQGADSAAQANRLATSASAEAARGGDVVEQVVKTMEHITAQSRRIAEIITVIDGIAFQTNILALNASVEAARAGEQGRGFAVVAGEVRNLAQRAAQAAREIKALIGESVAQIESGGTLVHEAGQTMHEIVAHVKQVSDLIGEVTAASREEGAGITQINDAVTQLDDVTQKNAALVEQSAAAAESLKHEAARLARAVAVFRV